MPFNSRPSTTPSATSIAPAGYLPHVPAPGTVPQFPPVRVRGGRRRLPRTPRRGRRTPAAILATAAAALAATGTVSTVSAESPADRAALAREKRKPPAVRLVSAPVRIADAATVRLLRPGDRVDVIAAANSPTGEETDARVIATSARVAGVPRAGETRPDGGALVVLSVPRSTATALAGASATSRLAVTLC
ncbi:RcpC/CpaB family pilus assembly protein [Streptomyces sp. NPDC048604]|uniref:RcpC/CpaB family pilus assembly protein n=1 Tax=Streptomyces sp. NPDC048604 TaxID=3365578 RepID=UPI00371A2392